MILLNLKFITEIGPIQSWSTFNMFLIHNVNVYIYKNLQCMPSMCDKIFYLPRQT